MSLLIKKHPQDDFFIADIFDQTAFKDDMASMEHPFFTLSIKPDLRTLTYENDSKKVMVHPSKEGLPSIFDKDFLIFCGSLLMENYNEGRKQDPDYLPPQTIRVTAHDFFKATNRADNGRSYSLFAKSLLRLRGCTIETTIKTKGQEEFRGFGFIESYGVVKSCKVKNRMVALEVKLSDWYYRSILGLEMLSINRDYFSLRKPLERRLYEIARKHCGSQKSWPIGLEKLFNKTGSSGNLRRFRHNLKNVIEDNHVPDYQYSLDSNDNVIVRRTKSIEADNPPRDEHTSHDMIFNFKRKISKQTLINSEKRHNDSFTDWSMDEIILQFIGYAEKTRKVKDVDAAFIGFLKKKIKTFKKDSYSN